VTVAQEIRRLKQKQESAKIAARLSRDAKKAKERLVSKTGTDRVPGSLMDRDFMRQLDAKARAARDAADKPQRADLDAVLEAARRKGHLATPDGREVEYVPTVEEILGDDALPKDTTPVAGHVLDADCPDPDTVLNTSAQYLPGPLSVEELAEIDRLNPKTPAKAQAPRHVPKHRPRRR
jgi:hypothetical protein